MADRSPESTDTTGEQYYLKTRPTACDAVARANARRNVDTHEWARAIRDEHVAKAEALLEHWDAEALWRLVPSQLLPRGNALDGDSNTYPGVAREAGWDWAQLDSPWTEYATAPSFDWELTKQVAVDGRRLGVTIPANDFVAYRESGRDDRGMFDPDRVDDSLLENTKNPALPADWGVDDGTGFVDHEGVLGPAGTQWRPVAWCCHWLVIYAIGSFLRELSMAYVLTGDDRYASPATILLDRVADVYPALSHRDLFDHYDQAFPNSNGGTRQGKFVGSIWEASQIRGWLRAYDRVFPGMADAAVEFLEGKRREYPELPPKGSLGAVRENIETRFVHEMLPAFRRAQIRGNFGFHQATLAMAAVVADDPEGFTGEALDYVFQPGTLLDPADEDNPTPGRWTTTGGDVDGFLVGSPGSGYFLDEDGYPTESAPHYNTAQQRSVATLASVVRGYDAYDAVDLLDHPKFRRALASHWQLTFGNSLPQIANTHGTGNPKAVAGATPRNDRTIQSVEFALLGFETLGKPELAQWAYMLNGLTTEGLARDVFAADPMGIEDEVERIVDERGAFPAVTSTMQPAYGFAGLRAGDPRRPRGVYQYFGRNSFGTGSAHTHYDTLSLGVYGYDLDLAPELGRTGTDWEGTDLREWIKSTPAHNTVTVDGENVHPQWVGAPRRFDHTERVQLMDIAAPRVYPQTDEYRRTTAMIEATADASYVVDIFRVAGGDDHRFSFHAMASPDRETQGLDLCLQDGGTYEDEAVGFGDGGPFSYLYDVERDAGPVDVFGVDWAIEDYWSVCEDDGDVHLRLTMLTPVDDVALAVGRPAEQATEDNPRELPFLLARRTGTDIRSTFASLVEPYAGERVVASVERLAVRSDDAADPDAVCALAIELVDGRVDYVFSSTDRQHTFVIDDRFEFQGAFAVVAESEGERAFRYTNDVAFLRDLDRDVLFVDRSSPRVTGVVEDFTRQLSTDNAIEVTITATPDGLELEDLVGRFIAVDPADPDPVPDDVREDDRYDTEARDRRNGTMAIHGAERLDDGRVRLDIGGHTPIRRYRTNDPDDGYSYSVEEGASFSISIGELCEDG